MAERYAQIYGDPVDRDPVKPEAPPLSLMMRDVPLTAGQAADFRRAEARRDLDNALRAEAEQAKQKQQALRDQVARATTIGALMSIGS